MPIRPGATAIATDARHPDRAAGLANPAASPIVKFALQRMQRRRGNRERQTHGLTWTFRERVFDTAGGRLIDARNRALVAGAYDALPRRSELCAVRVADLVRDARGTGTLVVPRSKTDPAGRSATVYIAWASMAVLAEWLHRAATPTAA